MTDAQLLVAEQGGLVLFHLIGRGTFKLCPAFRAYCEALLKDNTKKGVMLDLAKCVSMDSTFMGVMVMLGLRARNRLALLLVNARPEHRTLLDGIGVSRVWRYVSQPVPNLTWKKLGEATAGKGSVENMKDIAPLIIEAHEALIELDSNNIPEFQNIIDMIKEEQN